MWLSDLVACGNTTPSVVNHDASSRREQPPQCEAVRCYTTKDHTNYRYELFYSIIEKYRFKSTTKTLY